MATTADLRNATGEELEELYFAVIAEMDRRDREARTAQERAEAARVRRAAVRDEWEMYQHADYLAADAECRGNLLSKAGLAADVSEYSLWTGREDVARKYASEELNEYWDKHPRFTIGEFAKQRAADTIEAREVARDAREADQPARSGVCACGCGEAAARTFVRGHDAVYASKLTRAVRGGEMSAEQAVEAAGAISERFHGKITRALELAA